MKKIFICTTALCVLASCSSIKQVGYSINMISHRNVDFSSDYQPILTYSGTNNKEIRKTRAKSIDEAIDQTVKKVPGGEFLMNVKIYLVNGTYFAVEGDVWGKKEEISYRGFKVGDKVTWKVLKAFKKGTITSLKDDKTCLIQTETGETIEKKYDDISKVN